MIILSIDSGIEKTGYAIFRNKKYVISALIKTSKNNSTEIRLEEIYLQLKKVFKKYKPGKYDVSKHYRCASKKLQEE